MAKLIFALVLICLTHVCLSARIARDATAVPAKTVIEEKMTHIIEETKDSSSSEEITMAEVAKLKEELMKTMPEKDAMLITNIFKKFTPESTDDDKMEGFMKLMMIGFAASQNQTETQMMKMIEAFDSSEDKAKVSIKKE